MLVKTQQISNLGINFSTLTQKLEAVVSASRSIALRAQAQLSVDEREKDTSRAAEWGRIHPGGAALPQSPVRGPAPGPRPRPCPRHTAPLRLPGTAGAGPAEPAA